MGKHGPCRHCGVTTTPLWRNGPPDKPVLCNACGSRWRTKGSLTNYTPLHAREPINPEELKVSRVKSLSFKLKERKPNKIKIKKSCTAPGDKSEMPYSDQNFRKILEVDTSNQSSSGSATSYSESYADFGTTEASDLIAQSNIRESQVPSKQRMRCTDLEPSPVEKLTQDLYTIMQEQSYCLSSLSEDLLYESKTPVGSFELGNGSILLRYPNPKHVEEESEASSFPVDNKSCTINEANSGSASFSVHGESKGTSFSTVGIGEFKKCMAHWAGEHIKRDKSYVDKLHILQHRDSPLGFINLKDVKSELNNVRREGSTAFNSLGHPKFPLHKGPREMQNLQVPGPRGAIRSPKRVAKASVSGTNPQSTLIYDDVEFVDNVGTSFSPRAIFPSPPPERSSILSSIHFTDDSANHGLLVDVPSNNSSFPEAELLDHSYYQKLVGQSISYGESGVFGDGEESRSSFLASSFNGQKSTG